LEDLGERKLKLALLERLSQTSGDLIKKDNR
jgi:hypothetical protein